jgi:hypothetical protein
MELNKILQLKYKIQHKIIEYSTTKLKQDESMSYGKIEKVRYI